MLNTVTYGDQQIVSRGRGASRKQYCKIAVNGHDPVTVTCDRTSRAQVISVMTNGLDLRDAGTG